MIPQKLFRRLMPLATLCCLLLSRHGMAQNASKVLATAHASADPLVLVWVNTPQGTQPDDQRALSYKEQFAATDWTVRDNGILIEKNGQTLIQIGRYAYNKDQTWFVGHGRGSNFLVDGTIDRDPETKQGSGQLFVTLFNSDGTSMTIVVRAPLTFTQ